MSNYLAPLTSDTPCPKCGERTLECMEEETSSDGTKLKEEWACNCGAQFDQIYAFVKWEDWSG